MSGVLETAPMLEALDRLRGTGSEFHGFLANHGPMAADAMSRTRRDVGFTGTDIVLLR